MSKKIQYIPSRLFHLHLIYEKCCSQIASLLFSKMLTYTWFQFPFHANVNYEVLMMGRQNGEIHIVLYIWTCCINLIWECSKHLWTPYETFYLQILARCSWSWINICLKPRQDHVFQDVMCQTLTKRDIFLQMKSLQHLNIECMATFLFSMNIWTFLHHMNLGVVKSLCFSFSLCC
jgi:hypothetical protein